MDLYNILYLIITYDFDYGDYKSKNVRTQDS